jgi:hypothetical protein
MAARFDPGLVAEPESAVPKTRRVVRALLPFALLALSRAFDHALGMLLHTGLDLPGIVSLTAGLVEPRGLIRGTLLGLVAGAILSGLLALERSWRTGISLPDALFEEASTFDLLYAFPLVTLLALLSVGVHTPFPYAFTLPVALTQDLHPVLVVLVLMGLLAVRMPEARFPAPRAGAMFFISFLVYALLSPPWASRWDGHPGNEPKYLRMAASLAARWSFNVEPESALEEQGDVLEAATPEPLAAVAPRALAALVRESRGMLVALSEGPTAWGARAIRATRITRQTIRGKEGGVYHVLAPGPSLLLAPLLALDRRLDHRLGTPGRLSLTLLVWNALAAALVTSLYLLVRDLTNRPGIAALVAGFAGLTPPFLFYFFQFYPEPLGALVLTLALRPLLRRRPWKGREAWILGGLLAVLPWLHQKFLPVFGLLVLWALLRAVDEMVSLRAILALLAPQAVSLYLIALYNFAITGSIRPDALFLAWGPGGVSSARVGEGLLGLLLDLRYGLLPGVPIYILFPAGFLLAGRSLRLALPPLVAYYATVAAADNWSGAVCDLGRYVLPIAPFLAAAIAIALARVSSRRGAIAVFLVLSAWTGILAMALWADPHAATDSALLWERSTYADPHLYFPDLFFRSWNYGAPGQTVRVLSLAMLAGILAFWLRRAASGTAGRSVVRALMGLGGVLLATAFFLEMWPSSLPSPRFGNAVRLDRGATAYLTGPVVFDLGHVRARTGTLESLVSSGRPLAELVLVASGSGRLKVPGNPPWEVPPQGGQLRVPLEPLATLTGRNGRHEFLSRLGFGVESSGEVTLEFHAARQ